jgi:hypothetical protein
VFCRAVLYATDVRIPHPAVLAGAVAPMTTAADRADDDERRSDIDRGIAVGLLSLYLPPPSSPFGLERGSYRLTSTLAACHVCGFSGTELDNNKQQEVGRPAIYIAEI